MDSVQTIVSELVMYRYAALFVVTFLSSLGFPLPAAASTIAAAAFASQGYLNIYAVLAVALAGNITGDISLYSIVRKFGPGVLRFLGLKKYLSTSAFQDVTKTVDAYKAPVLIASRLQVQTTAIVNILCGLGKMNFRKFAFYISIGEATQILAYGLLGYVFAESWEALYSVVGKFGWVIAIVMTVSVTWASKHAIRRMLK